MSCRGASMLSWLFVGLGVLSTLSPIQAEAPFPTDSTEEPHELIVLLAARPDTPSPEAVVEQARQKRPLSANLGMGNPLKVDFGISRRASGETLKHLRAHPDSPRAMLERYLVFTYPAGAPLEVIAEALRRNPNVLHVERNLTFELSVVPSDPLFSDTDASGNPRPAPDHQWGSYALKLPSKPNEPPGAWDYTTGHAYVGIVDTGIATNHEDLRPFTFQNGQLVHIGNFREHFSYDYHYNEPNVDEGKPQLVAETNTMQTPTHGGHGTHVAGIIGATANNQGAGDINGVAGVCWHCSLMIAKATPLKKRTGTTDEFAPGPLPTTAIAAAITGLMDDGAQLINMSFGKGQAIPNCNDPYPDPNTEAGMYCIALKYAHDRDVLMVASSGNGAQNFDGEVNFPARHPFVIAAGGIIPGGAFWDTCDLSTDTKDCPSKYGPDQELVAPARQVLSTFYPGLAYVGTGCGDGWGAGGLGYGPCTGTSMSSPYVTGVAALLRSVNPLLLEGQVRDLLKSYASNLGAHNNQTGYGTPDAAASIRGALGEAGGTVLANRLTPLFSVYSLLGEDYFYTTAPQMATAAIFHIETPYQPAGPAIPGYPEYPGGQCIVSPCWPADPTASVYIFTTDKAPFVGAPPLVPLYRMSYIGATATNPSNKDTTYTTENGGIVAFKNVGYKLDGIEGYIYKRCTPEPSCIPAGAVRLYRLYNAERDDFAIFPESELAQMQAAGYASSQGLNDWIGYVYPNADGDLDNVINGFEGLIGTDPSRGDSDCDGLADGAEILGYPNTDPLVANSGPGCVLPKDARVLSQSVPATMAAGRVYAVSVTLKNAGTETWSPIGPQCGAYRLGSANPYNNGTWVSATRVELSAPVAPGQQVTLNFTVTAPSTPGTYNFQWRMVQECVTWFGDFTPNVAVSVQAAPPRDAQILSQNVPSAMVAGQSYGVSIRLRNVGTQSWSPIGAQCNAYRLGSANPYNNSTWVPATRVELPAPVAPGGEVTLSFTVTAPATPGTYNFQWRMVQECVTWFGDFSPNVAVSVN